MMASTWAGVRSPATRSRTEARRAIRIRRVAEMGLLALAFLMACATLAGSAVPVTG
jgi:hypothetical protein